MMKVNWKEFADVIKQHIINNQYEIIDTYMKRFNPDDRVDIIESEEYKQIEEMTYKMLNSMIAGLYL